jgi:hypothetical protein
MVTEGTSSPLTVVEQAHLLLSLFQNYSNAELSNHADDFLSYFYTLHDNYEIVKSTSPRFSGTTFIILEDIIYRLESDPDSVFESTDFRECIVQVLSDITSRRILLKRKQRS